MPENLNFETEPSPEGEPMPEGEIIKKGNIELSFRGDTLTLRDHKDESLPIQHLKVFAELPNPSTPHTERSLTLTIGGWDIFAGEDPFLCSSIIRDAFITDIRREKARQIISTEAKKRIDEGEIRPDLTPGILALIEGGKIEEKPESGDGLSPENPIVRQGFLTELSLLSFGKYNLISSDPEKGTIKIATRRMERRGNYYEIQVFDRDGNLNRSAFDILKHMPGRFSNFYASTLSKPVETKGKFIAKYVSMRSCRVNREEHKRIQEAILELAEAKPERQPVAKIIESIFKNHKEISELKRERQLAGEIQQVEDPFLGELDQQTENPMEIKIPPEKLVNFLTSLQLPQNARIEGLKISFDSENSCSMAGRIDIPVPFVGGSIDFSLRATQKENQHGIVVSDVNMQTESNFLRGQLPKVIEQFSEIDQLLLGQINARLKRNQVDKIELKDQSFVMRVAPKK